MKFLLSAIITVWLAGSLAVNAQTATNPPPDELRALIKSIEAKIVPGKNTEAEFAEELKTFDRLIAVAETNRSPAAAELIYMKAVLFLQVFNEPDKCLEQFKKVSQNYPETEHGKSAAKLIEPLTRQLEAKKIQSALAVGTVFPDFAEKDLDGKPLSVGTFKGKVVLVDFWATWCGPCIMTLPEIITAYKDHHADGFEVVGISLDDNRDDLDKFLKRTKGMTWPQFYEGKRFDNKLAVKYGVGKIPSSYLIGSDGVIIGIDLHGKDLQEAVAKALAK